VVGWQNESTLFQVGPARLVGRGCTLGLAASHATRRNGQSASYGTTSAADALRGFAAVETRLPSTIGVVMIALDALHPTAAQSGDLGLAVTGATLAPTPLEAVIADRRLLLYDVASVSAGTAILVSVASASAWSVAGVMGARGTAAQWSAQLKAGKKTSLVPDDPLCPGGSLTVLYSSRSSG
jgi:hypothetical protein